MLWLRKGFDILQALQGSHEKCNDCWQLVTLAGSHVRMKDMLYKVVRLPRGVIPASIKASKPYGKLRGKLQGLLASHNSIYDADNYARDIEPAAVQSAGPISNSIRR